MMAKQHVYTLPFPMPTWNVILSMSIKERCRCKKLIHALTSMSIALERSSQIPTETASNGHLMLLHETREQYLMMIRPRLYARAQSRKSKASPKKPYSRSRRLTVNEYLGRMANNR